MKPRIIVFRIYQLFLFLFILHPNLLVAYGKYLVRNPRVHQWQALNESFPWVFDEAFEKKVQSQQVWVQIKWT